MLCDDCKKRLACVHITKITNDHKTEKHLCEECAQEYGEMKIANVVINTKLSVQDFLKGMFNNCFLEQQHQEEGACEHCGMTYSEFSRSGKIGCAGCYAAFSGRLEPLIRRIHGASAHTGKVPKRTGGIIEVRQRLKRMKQELERHIACEEYEMAATVRDEIKTIEKEIKGLSPLTEQAEETQG